MTKTRVLIVEDDLSQLEFFKGILERSNFEVVGVSTIEKADKVVLNALKKNERFQIVFVDLHVEQKFGGDFAKRIFDNTDFNVVIMTIDHEAAMSLLFQPDEILIKGVNSATIIETAKKLVEPRRQISETLDIRINRWKASTELEGIISCKVFSREVDQEGVEKIVARTSDVEWISWTIYPNAINDLDAISIGVSCCIGCPSACAFCLNWRGLVSNTGLPVNFKRPLTSGEIVAQFYLATQSVRLSKVLKKRSKKKVIFNFSCSGDIAYNLNSACDAVQQLSKISKPKIEFIFTTIGTLASLFEYRRRYIHLPITFYLSATSLDVNVRRWLVPGSIGQPIEQLLDSVEQIAMTSKRIATISLVVIRGLTDRNDDVKLVKKLISGRKWLSIKLMKLAEGSLEGFTATDEDVNIFLRKLNEAGVDNNIRIRKILGLGIMGGCGNTLEKWRI